MARRLFKGNEFSENGWPYVDTGSCTWRKVPGANVTLQIQNGPPLAVLAAFAADFNEHVEPLRDADSACWTLDNSVSTSNHPAGTGMDLNWNGEDGRTFRLGISEERAYPGGKARKLRELLDFYEGVIFCGGNWDILDWMHFQLGGNTYDQRNDRPDPRVLDFIARKIRADGFSTFRRGNKPLGAAPVLAAATGLSEARAAEILSAVSDGLRASQCTNANRIAMWLAQVGHESGSFVYTEEIASGAAYEGRTDLGNTHPGDGMRFKGRSWIQITGRNNYGLFSQWAFKQRLVSTPTYFVDHSTELGELKWAGIGAAWYWTVARSDINTLSDRQDLETVTRRINGGTNGLADRRDRYNRALLQGDALLQLLTNGDDDMAQVPQDQWDTLYRLFTQPSVASVSMYATPGEGPIYNLPQLIASIDGAAHKGLTVEADAKLGDLEAISRIARVAAGQGARTDAAAVAHAKSVLAEIEATNPAALQQFISQKGQS